MSRKPSCILAAGPITILSLLLIVIAAPKAMAGPNVLRYVQPAKDWQSEALPIGNGRLGGMIFGDVSKEHIQFNEDTVWIGDEQDTGAYQAFGDLFIELNDGREPATTATSYRRELNIDESLHTITYQKGGVNYKREYFASYPADVLVFRLSADKKGAYSGAITLKDAHNGELKAQDNKLMFSGTLSGKYRKPKENYAIRLQYEAQVMVINQGGSLKADDGKIVFKDCDELLILLDGGTDYLNKSEKGWKQEHPHKKINKTLAKAAKLGFDELLKEHIADYRNLFNRVTLDLGKSADKANSVPTPERLDAYRGAKLQQQKKMVYEQDALNLEGGIADPDLEELLFQYARYLMISCSRPGSLPANLQGLWNMSNRPTWRCDYHLDVNIQMNYWFVDQANLSDCFTPLSEWLWSVIPVKREATKARYHIRGWMTKSENGIFGGMSYRWSAGDGAWIMQNIWDHYAFTLDKDYLKTRAYPMIKELCEFWEDYLLEKPDGTLVSPRSRSPEHGPVAEGNSYEQQLVYNLFSNYIEASKELGIDAEFREKVRDMRSRLLGPQIGNWGQLQEWAQDIDKQNDKHRHLSHLIAVHPGRQISPLTTPKLAEAAKVSMNARGDGGTGWSKSWKISIWARLLDGNRAYKLLQEQLKGNFYPNLFGFHPPYQIDGDFGYASGVCEMLLQSHMGEIHLLPALPDAWPTGSIRGIRARGGFEVDLAWSEGQLSKAVIRSGNGRTCRLRSAVPLTINQGGKLVATKKIEDGLIEFSTKKGGAYQVTPKTKRN